MASAKSADKRGRIDADFFAHPQTDRLNAIEEDPRSIPLAALCSTKTSGFTPKVESLRDGEIDFATIDCISPLNLHKNNFKRIPKSEYEAGFVNARKVTKGSVLCTIKRRICQAYPFLTNPAQPLAFNQDIALLRPKPEQSSPVYLAAYLGSSIGQALASREQTEQMNPYLSLIGLGNLPVVLVSPDVQSGIKALFLAGEARQRASRAALAQAEALLLDALGLRGWSPPEPLTYTRSAAAVAEAGRLDAEFAAPRVQALLGLLASSGQTLADVAEVRREKFKPATEGTFDYIEIGDLDGYGRCSSTSLDMIDAPSRATWHVRPGDVLTSTVRPIRRLSAIVADSQDGHVCSSGFVVLEPTAISPECLLTFLRLPLVCELMHLFATASMYPALAEKDLMALPIPAFDRETDLAVASAVAKARAELARSESLLEAAKRAVEIAIEDSEAAALAFIAAQEAG